MNTFSKIALLVMAVYIIGYLVAITNKLSHTPTPKQTLVPYTPYIIDDHEVQLINGTDTIRLYLENANVIREEYTILVTK